MTAEIARLIIQEWVGSKEEGSAKITRSEAGRQIIKLFEKWYSK